MRNEWCCGRMDERSNGMDLERNKKADGSRKQTFKKHDKRIWGKDASRRAIQ